MLSINSGLLKVILKSVHRCSIELQTNQQSAGREAILQGWHFMMMDKHLYLHLRLPQLLHLLLNFILLAPVTLIIHPVSFLPDEIYREIQYIQLPVQPSELKIPVSGERKAITFDRKACWICSPIPGWSNSALN